MTASPTCRCSSPSIRRKHRGWAAKSNLPFTDLASFSQLPEVRSDLQTAVDLANQEVARVEQIKKFTIVSDIWSPDSGEITPSLKLKRNVVLDRYRGEIEEMYS